MRRFIGETIRVETQLPPTPLWVPGDKAALEQVLLNLCINARDAMADGAGTLSLAVAETQWPGGSMGHAGEWLPAGAYAVLTVRDS
ncbi:MAG: hypothetical protein GWO16_14600, partial [Gammaproteobacteria bacterium]|nr:hypothetical protein [Gammaproteobacteria bacterium]NIR98163.1 hypothetical protein [Gammaproteobacteria bacterium]NIT63832.1 hypothetical protein [Gammaproteobacteria bacterium]NIV21749.1 hypothetical protein [Gammaproteobacteria bacterium]NIY32412.1 hypothetical protein [Gammaproteobacteria bacterium]